MRKTVFGVSVLFVVSIWVGELRATYLEPADLQRLTQQAQVILVGQSTAIKSAWNADRTLIFTYATYDVEEAVKGVLKGQRVVVKALGGTVGSITQMVVDGPTFTLGERSLLFLVASDEPATLRIQGLSQGKSRVYSDPTTGEYVLIRGASRLTQRAQGPTGALQRGGALPRTEPLAQVLQEIRRYLQKTLER